MGRWDAEFAELVALYLAEAGPRLAAASELAEGLRAGGSDAHCLAFPSPQGHDAFLVDFERFGPAVRGFLDAL